MSALSYISEYGSNSEDSDCEIYSASAVKKIKLHVPDLSNIAVVPKENIKDNPAVHGGRKRSFPHERGNWASFIYVKYPDEEFLHNWIEKLREEVSCVEATCEQCDNIHISLSKTFILKYHLINPFTSSLQEVLGSIECFELSFGAIKVYCNEENTRTFISLEVDYSSNKYLSNISNKIDQVLEEYKLPKFYDDPSFHVSLLWFHGNKKRELKDILEKLNNTVQQDLHQHNKTGFIDKLNCKIGNKYFQYSLQP
ncbi:U6 snRNA phosphodiesterase 1 [Plodia interpunctella]|uniref:U6 snRNA phosphodiesterase 1 n=1 Tax=Plodia interpunctella TaxID=58824 RepID=UPI0023686EB8|nr:U6 snRNA phosphodiesterase 1 [Plodia interpunctella]